VRFLLPGFLDSILLCSIMTEAQIQSAIDGKLIDSGASYLVWGIDKAENKSE
jgi:hypothetical protein